MSASRPNFLIFVTDQQRADHLGCYGNAAIRTPHIDALAARGVVFDRFHVAAPVCMPNRAALATGRMPSIAGVRMNGVPLPLAARTHVDALRDAGWRTALVGKCHLQNMTENAPAWQGATGGAVPPEAVRDRRTGVAYEQESVARWRDPAHEVTLPYYGFDHVEFCLEHGDEVAGHYARWLAARGVHQATVTGPQRSGASDGIVAPQAWRTGLREEDYPSAYIRDRAIAWLTHHAAEAPDAPFYLQCSFPDPHHPFTPPGRWFDAYGPDDVTLPASFAATDPRDNPIKTALHAELAAGHRNAARSSRAIAVRADEARQAIALNYGSISCIDAMVGDITRALDRLDLAQNTVVVFLSDHGDFMGDHGLLLKGPLHYRSLVRMPFVWSDPALAPGRRDQLASAIDFAPTVLARAGVAPYYGIQGIDLAPALASADARTREALVVEEEGHRTVPGLSGVPRVRTLVTSRWRLSLYAGQSWGELFDLHDDRDELHNRFDDTALARERGDLAWLLADHLTRLADDCPRPTRMA